jgi:hypothetical protein
VITEVEGDRILIDGGAEMGRMIRPDFAVIKTYLSCLKQTSDHVVGGSDIAECDVRVLAVNRRGELLRGWSVETCSNDYF